MPEAVSEGIVESVGHPTTPEDAVPESQDDALDVFQEVT